jgi:DNA-directed DNA polymerase III PolC
MAAESTFQNITHLNVHSHYTLLGATATVDELVQRAASQGMQALALTDTNALYGAIRFAERCKAAGIQPITGMTLSVAPPEEMRGQAWTSAAEIVLLATGASGWRSLCALSSAIQARPDREEAAQRGVEWDTLREHHAGLICLAGGRRSWLGRALQSGHPNIAARYASRLAGIFGEQAWLSIDAHSEDGGQWSQVVLEIGKRFGMPIVAVQPVFCVQEEDRQRLRLLAAMANNCALADVPASALPDAGDTHIVTHWLAPDAMIERFAPFPTALAGIGEIVAQCGDALPDGKPIWPVLKLEAGERAEDALLRLANAGVTRHYAEVTPALAQRLTHELGAINRSGFAPLFLLVADITRFAREHEIPYNTRGSVANSLVAYCIGITTVDPVAHDLLFERFLNPERASLPDIDLDLCSHRRDEVLAYVRELYGEERVALVATMATLRLKSAVRETAKAFGLGEEVVNKLAGMVREQWHPDPRRKTSDPLESIIADLDDPHQIEVVRTAFTMVGVPHHLSIHPGGVVVAPTSITEIVPVQWTPKGFLVAQFPHEDIEALGLPKIDLLGIRALTVLADAVELVRRHHKTDFRLSEVPVDDEQTATLLAQGETVGVFQCESSGAQRTLRQLQARTVRDLAVANAFFKPGPATGGMAQAFVRRYRGEEAVSYLHPALETILAPTQGVMLFQEQVLRVAREIAGLSWAEADRIRKGMSKFRADEMAALQSRFEEGCQRSAPDGHALDATQARTLWAQVMAFAGYGFNQGHATAYADVSYRSAYLKAHWPAEFLCARLADWGGFHHQSIYIAEARRLGIVVRPPHVNHSRAQFTLAWEAQEDGPQPVLWMGLGQVRDLRRASIRAIVTERRRGQFRSALDLLNRVPLARKEWTHLIQAGALDGLGESRNALLAEVGARNVDGGGQLAFTFVTEMVTSKAGTSKAGTGEDVAQCLLWETRLLGLPVSQHPLATVQDLPPLKLGGLATQQATSVTVAGVRLPGWTGGKGWFLGDEQHYVMAITPKGMANPRPWRPIQVQGRWIRDEWGDCWLQVDSWSELGPK